MNIKTTPVGTSSSLQFDRLRVMEKARKCLKKPKQVVLPAPLALVALCLVLFSFVSPLHSSPLSASVSSANVTNNSAIVSEATQLHDSSHLTDQTFLQAIFTNIHPNIALALAIVVRVLIFLYSCVVIGYLCDEYFVPSLESIGRSLDWPSDLIGSILIPFGTSGPEIFSSAVGVFFAENDIGTGAILGSAVFNMLAIPAASGVAACYFLGCDIRLEELPVLRDLVFYIVSIVVLILVIKDNSVDFLDSSLMLIMFVVYIVVMIYNAKYNKQSTKEAQAKSNASRIETINHSLDSLDYQLEYWKSDYNNNQDKLNVAEDCFLNDLVDSYTQRSNFDRNKNDYEKIIEDDTDDNGVGFTDNRYLRWLLLPFVLIFSLCMPTRFAWITFGMSIVWLSSLSYVTVWSINGLSLLLGIPSTISGLTFLAAGSAVPDLVTSVIIIKKTGTASMSICAAIASNIFAILLGLGLPWAIRLGLNWHKTGVLSRSAIALESSALPYITIVLLVITFALYFTFTYCQWKLSKKFALICFVIHAIFIAVSCSFELLPGFVS